MVKTVDCLGYPVYSQQRLDDLLLKDKLVVNTINPHSYCVAKKDKSFFRALQFSDILLPDGIGFVWAIRLLTGRQILRFPGSDVHSYLLKRMDEIGGTIFYLGSTPSTLKKIQRRVMKEYPNIVVATYSPPFKPSFTEEDNARMLGVIAEFKPDVLFVGMTAPKQEKWVYKNKNKIEAKVICSVGAVFDFYSGNIKRPGKIWEFFYLEWFIRLLHEPSRLWKRNFISSPLFLYDVVVSKIIAVYRSRISRSEVNGLLTKAILFIFTLQEFPSFPVLFHL